MSKVVGDIAIKVGADTASLTTGMRGAEASLAKFAKVGGAAVAAVGVAMVALTKQSMANIDVLAKHARSLGLTTSAFQKMTLVAKEAGMESGKLSSLLGIMQKNLDELGQGTKAQTDAFDRLGLTIRDLQGLSPDEQFAKIAASLEAITDPAEKTGLAMQVFGRSGREAINMLSGYGAAAANAAAFQERFGIAVSQSTSEGVERANDAVGRLKMVFEGLGNTMAGMVAPAVEKTANAIIAFVGHVAGAKVTLEEFFGTLERARDVLGEDVFNQLVGDPSKIAAVRDELEGLANQTVNLAVVAANAGQSLDDLVFQLSAMGAADAANEAFAIAEGLADADRQFQAGTISADEFRAKLLETTTQAKSLLGGLEGVNDARFGGVIADLGNLISSLGAAAGEAMRLRMNLPGAWEMAPSDGSSVTGFEPDPNAPRTRPQAQGVDSFGNFSAAGSSRGGGGGGSNPMTARIEALVASLQTEREIIDAWYAESLEALTMASDAELAAIGGKHEAMERLEKEHQERLNAIRQMGNQWGVQAALDGGAEVLGAMGAFNKKALKAQAVFAEGSALMSAYQGAAAELKAGTFGFARAAAVLAKGFGFVAAIRSAGSSASSGIAASSGAGGAASASPPPQQIANVTLIGDVFSRASVEATFNTINKGLAQGLRINSVGAG